MPSDAELRDAAVAELKLTTAGWRTSKGKPNYPSGTAPSTSHWGKAMAALEQIGQAAPPPPPPPPPASTPWQGYSHAINLNSQVALPDRHIVYQPDGSVNLTCFADTPPLGTDRQLVSAYLSQGAQSAEGRRVRYETRMTFPTDFKGTTGEINFWFEWHTMAGQGSGQLSCAIGGRCDYPVDYTKPGQNLTWFFRPIGPGGSPPLNEMIGPPIQVGRSYALKVEVLWSSSNGQFKVFLDGQQLRDFHVPTLWPGDDLLLGVYNYRLKVPFASTLNYTKPVVTVLP